MQDTPQHIKDLQLKIWLSKPPMERLKQLLIDNDALFKFWKNIKTEILRHHQVKQKINCKKDYSSCF